MDRRDLDDMEARLLHAMKAEAKQTRLEVGEKVRSVGLAPALLGAMVVALLTTGGVVLFWGFFQQ